MHNTYFSNHTDRLFHDSRALERELQAEMRPSYFWEVLNEKLLQRTALKFLIWYCSVGPTACHLGEISYCLTIKIIWGRTLSPFSNATQFPIIHYPLQEKQLHLPKDINKWAERRGGLWNCLTSWCMLLGKETKRTGVTPSECIAILLWQRTENTTRS